MRNPILMDGKRYQSISEMTIADRKNVIVYMLILLFEKKELTELAW